MKKIHIKVNGETVGSVDSLKINQSIHQAGGSASRIRFDKVDLFKSFYSNIQQNFPVKLEFETDESIWQAHDTWITKYSFHESADENIIIVDDIDFVCTYLNLLQKEQTPTELAIEADPREQEDMINKFAAALSKYYKDNK